MQAEPAGGHGGVGHQDRGGFQEIAGVGPTSESEWMRNMNRMAGASLKARDLAPAKV
jgi:hypothetical protein